MDETSGQSLDPFEFHGHPASNIPGLGGNGPVPDPTYAFHTTYVPVARGHAHFRVRFTDLQARRGSLVLRVHMMPDGPGATASLVTSHRVQLNWLSHHGGEVQLRFEAFRGARYAVMGLVPDQLDASAQGLSVMLDRPIEDGDLALGDAAEAGATAYGSDTIASVSAPLLVSLDPPSFAQPVSQPCTTEQLRETAFSGRCRTMRDLPPDPAIRWQIAYAVQALDRYGMLQPGARGLALGPVHDAIVDAITSSGASCHRVTLSEGADATSSHAVIDPESLPGDLFAFDFLLSVRATDGMGDGRRATRFLERAMECLRPGGFAVNLVGYHANPAALATVAFDRNGLERLAISLISRGHQMARVKPALTQHLPQTADASIPFGLLTRRATLIR